jgi:hypothetical protein
MAGFVFLICFFKYPIMYLFGLLRQIENYVACSCAVNGPSKTISIKFLLMQDPTKIYQA